jgi:site-specific recombinase XerD
MFMGRLQPPPRPVGAFSIRIEAFADYMRDEQGLSPNTICGRVALLHDFLLRLNGPRHSLRSIKVQDVDRVLTSKYTLERYGRATIQTQACSLRAFFRFAERKGWCRAGLAAAIQSPRVYRNESVPFGPSWDDVQRLLATTEGDRTSSIRNRAVILLLSVYGLRAGEVVRLRLEDFDWEGERLRVQRPKQRKAQEFPLVRVVGSAVLRYLKHARPTTKLREVFVTCRPPYRPLHSGTLWPVVARPLRALKVRLPHHGPHCLRHACATHLLNAGLSLKEIGDQLGHTHPDTTRIYAKVDLTHLREVGRIDLRGLL